MGTRSNARSAIQATGSVEIMFRIGRTYHLMRGGSGF